MALNHSKIRQDRLNKARSIGTHSSQEWVEMYIFFEYHCARCFIDVRERYRGTYCMRPTKDHIIPLYQGGSDSIKNIQPLCGKCNSAKGPDSTDYRPQLANFLHKILPSKWVDNG